MDDQRIRECITRTPDAFPGQWVWDCDVHGVRGVASDQEEARRIALTHEALMVERFETDALDEYEPCDLATGCVPERRVGIEVYYESTEDCACGLERHYDRFIHDPLPF